MKNNILANFIGKFWSILSNFLFIPLYIHYLGFESYSIISFTLVIAGLMAILDAGLTATLSREFARIDTSYQEKIRTFETLETSYFIISGISIFSIFSLSGIISEKWLVLNNFNASRVSFFIKIVSFDVGFQLLLRFYVGGLLGLEKQIQANKYIVGWGILRNSIVVVAILFFPKLEVFFGWQTISTIIFAILIGRSLRRTLTGENKFGFSKIEKSVFRRIWRFAAGMLLISLVASLNTQMDKLAISKLLPIESLGYYTLAVSLAMGIVIIINPISVALLPRFTALYSANRNDEARELFQKINLVVSILVFSIMSIMIFFAKEIIWVWTGKMELALHTYSLVPIISTAFAMLSLQIIPYNIAIANGYTKLNNLLGLISLLVTLPGYWIITKSNGAIGAAYVFCVVQTATTIVYIYCINRKFIHSKKISTIYIKQMLLPMVISLCVSFGFSFLPPLVADNRQLAFAWIGAATIITFTTTSFILIPLDEIKKIFKLNHSLSHKT